MGLSCDKNKELPITDAIRLLISVEAVLSYPIWKPGRHPPKSYPNNTQWGLKPTTRVSAAVMRCSIYYINTNKITNHLTFAVKDLFTGQDIYVICRPGGPYWEKLCPRS